MKRLFLCAFLGTLCGTGMYAQEQGNKAEFVVSDDSKTLTIKGQGDLTAVSSFTTDLTNKIKDGQFETVTFENEGATPLYINGAIINSIVFFSEYGASSFPNTTMTILDLGQTTCKEQANVNSFQSICQVSTQSSVSLTLTFPKAEDGVLNFAYSGWGGCDNGYITSVIIPEGYTEIGKFTLSGYKSLTSVSFPSTLDKINDGAFCNDLKLRTLNLNEGLRYIGNGAFYWQSNNNVTLGTLKVPSTVKYIGPAAFAWHEYGDIYFTSTVAPLMPEGKFIDNFNNATAITTAFYANTQYGNNGFHPEKTEGTTQDDVVNTGFANRENYRNGSAYFSIIHYPKGLTEEQANTYADQTRKYFTIEDSETWNDSSNTYADYKRTVGKETSTLSYNGQSTSKEVTVGYKDTYVYGDYIWPSQTQWCRAYVTAGCGVQYDGVTPYRTALTEDELAILKEAGYDTSDSNLDNLQKIAHFGTRLFVLANGDATKGEDYPIPMKGGQWWTLCVPFNMTLKQVKETFGDDTQVCIFSGVDRKFQVEEDGGKTVNGITLKFQVDATQNNVQKSGDGTWTNTDEAVSDNDIVIYAHESYMIHPSATPEDAVFVVKNYQPVEGAPQPTIVESEDQVMTQAADEGQLYRFIGNYNTENSIPQYSYVFGKRAQDTAYKFWFYTGNTLFWAANKSIVEVADHDGGTDDYDNFFNIETGQQTKQVSLFGDDKEVTAIETPNVTIKAGKDADAPIYSIDGRLVSSNGDTANLAKGIYVQAGKKFVVK